MASQSTDSSESQPLLPTSFSPQSPRLSKRENNQNKRTIWFNLIHATTGTSTLALPLMVMTLGVIPAIIVLIVQGLLSWLSKYILSRESQELDRDTYQGVMQEAFKHSNPRVGRIAGILTASSLVLNGLGKVVVWLIILPDVVIGNKASNYHGLLPEIMRWREHFDKHAWYMSRSLWTAIFGILSLPALSFRSFKSVKWISLVGDIGVLFFSFASVVLAIIAAIKHKARALHLWPSSKVLGLSGAKFYLHVVAALPVLLSSVFNQHTVLSVTSQLHPYDQWSMDKASAGVDATIVISKLALAIGNLFLFGTSVKSDVLLNYTTKAISDFLHPKAALTVATAIRLSFVINGITKLPMYLTPVQENYQAIRHGEDEAEDRLNNRRKFVLTNYAAVAASVLVASLLADIKPALSVLGATAVGFLAYLAPAWLVLRKESEYSKWWVRLGAWVMVVLAVVQLGAGTISVFVK